MNLIELMNSFCNLLSEPRLTTVCDLKSFSRELASKTRNFSAPPIGKAGAMYKMDLSANFKQLFLNKAMKD
jgi:hypothetical protein